MITREQINAFHMIATCSYACQGINWLGLKKICDPQAKVLFDKLWLVRGWLSAISGYDPDDPYCLNDTQVLNIIEAIKKNLNICGDVNSLPEKDIEQCCPDSGEGTIVFNEFTYTCQQDGDALIYLKATFVNGSGYYRMKVFKNGVFFNYYSIPTSIYSGVWEQTYLRSLSPYQIGNIYTLQIEDIYKGTISNQLSITIINCLGGRQPDSGSGSGNGAPDDDNPQI